MPARINEQRDFICTQCPIQGGCDEQSLYCAFRWATDPNAAQRRVMLKGRLVTKTKRRKLSAAIMQERKNEYNRESYGPEYREQHRDKKRAYDRERYQQRKQEQAL